MKNNVAEKSDHLILSRQETYFYVHLPVLSVSNRSCCEDRISQSCWSCSDARRPSECSRTWTLSWQPDWPGESNELLELTSDLKEERRNTTHSSAACAQHKQCTFNLTWERTSVLSDCLKCWSWTFALVMETESKIWINELWWETTNYFQTAVHLLYIESLLSIIFCFIFKDTNFSILLSLLF